jgi:predicted PurR-regulated permease PerM
MPRRLLLPGRRSRKSGFDLAQESQMSHSFGPYDIGDSSAASAPSSPGGSAPREVSEQVARSVLETEQLVTREKGDASNDPDAVRPGAPLDRRSPLYLGFMAVLGGLLAYGLVHVVLQLSQLLTLVLLAFFLSLGLEPIVARLVGFGVGRGWAVLLVFLGLVLVFALLGWLIVPTVVDQTTQAAQSAPDYFTHLRRNRLVVEANSRWHVINRVEHGLDSFATHVSFMSLFGGVLGAGKAIVNGIVATVTVLVLTLYFLTAMPRAKTAMYQLVPRSRRPRVVYLGEEISSRVGGYVLGQIVIASINGALSYVILRVLGLPFPAVLAVIVGLLALIPVAGTLIGGALVTLVGLASGWTEAVIVLCYYIAYHLVEAYLLGPRIMKRAVEVPVAVTIVAVLAGETLLGILGALVAIPIAAGLLLIYEQVVVPRQQRM